MEPGEVIDGKYRVDRQIGEGGMGQVLAVTHTKLGKQYAIKVVKPAAFQVPGIAERFQREARAASRLKSEHVGEVTDVGELPTGEPYMVMELLAGEDLGNIIDENGRLSAELAVDYVLQASEALAEAHALGMVHRDIKPANLFLTERRDGSKIVKVLDFGIATAARGEVSGLTETHSVMGSPQYMSPEQLRSAKIVDARSDIWSLGVTLYELVSQRQPFDGTTFTALAIKIATEAHEPLVEASPELALVVDRCLMKDPAKRYADIAELAIALAGFAPSGDQAAARVTRALRGSGTVPAPRATASGHDVPPHAAVTIRDPKSTAPEHLVASTTLGGSASSFASLPTRGPQKRMLATLGVVAIGATIGVVAVRRASTDDRPPAPIPVQFVASASPPAPQPDPAPPGPPAHASSRIQIRTVPLDAEIRIDDAAVPNPYDAPLPRDDVRHHVEIRAAGYKPSSQWLIFPTDHELVVTLDKEPAAKLATPQKPASATAVATHPAAQAEAGIGSNTPIYKGTKGNLIRDYPSQ